LQSIPSDILVQLPGNPAATPSSARPAEASASGTDAFATALQLLLAGMPAGALNEGGTDPAGLGLLPSVRDNSLFASALQGFENGSGQSSSALIATFSPMTLLSSPVSDTDSSPVLSPPGGSLVPALAAMMALSQGSVATGETISPGATAVAMDSPASLLDSPDTTDRVAGNVPADDLLSWFDTARGSGQRLTVQLPLTSEPIPGTSDSSASPLLRPAKEIPSQPTGTAGATRLVAPAPTDVEPLLLGRALLLQGSIAAVSIPADTATIQTVAQLASKALSAQPDGQLVTDALVTQAGGQRVTDALVTQVGGQLVTVARVTQAGGQLVTDALVTQAGGQRVTDALVTQVGGQLVTDARVTQAGGQLVTDALVTQAGGQRVTDALVTQVGGQLVTDARVTETDGHFTQPVAVPPGMENPQPPVTDGSAPALDIVRMNIKSLPSRPGNESVVEHLDPPIPPAGEGSSVIPKSSGSLPAVPLVPDSTPESAAMGLRAKGPGTAGMPEVSPEARVLASKMTELGLPNLSVRAGRSQSKSADRLESLRFGLESVVAVSATRERDALIVPPAQPSRAPSIERVANPNDLDRKRGERVAGAEPRNLSEPAQKESAGTTQQTSNQSALASKETGLERSQPASSVRFVVEEPKPVRVPGQITVRLEPPELGRLKIDLLTGSSGIIGRLRFASDAVRTVVERDIAQLHRSLSEAGIRVERLEIVGVSPTVGERSSLSSQTPGEQQTSQRQSQGQNRHGEPKENSWGTGQERSSQDSPPWMEHQTSPWLAMTAASQGLNLVA